MFIQRWPSPALLTFSSVLTPVASSTASLSPHTQMAAVEYLVSTLTSELEAEQIMSIEDVFGVIQVRFCFDVGEQAGGREQMGGP